MSNSSFGGNNWRPLIRYAGIAVAGYGVYKAAKAGRVTPHLLLAVVGLISAIY